MSPCHRPCPICATNPVHENRIQRPLVERRYSAFGFIKQSQWVFIVFPPRWPKSGGYGASDRTSRKGTWTSDHLKTRTPSLSRTRKHSANPFRSVSFQSSGKAPYFSAVHDVFPTFTRCGGSKTTSLYVSSSKGRHVKSHTVSGAISMYRFG